MSYLIDDAVIDLKDQEAGENAIKDLCRRILPGWFSLQNEHLKITRISGGISNLLVKVTPASVDTTSITIQANNCNSGYITPPEAESNIGAATLRPVAVKVFGDKTELLIDRDTELKTLVKLGEAGFGAKVLAVFGNGRIEEFLTAVTLSPEDMADAFYVPRIAKKLRQFHDLPPGEQQPGLVFATIQGWMDMAKSLTFTDAKKAELFATVDLEAMQRDIDETRRLCEAVQSPVVFAHNDLLSGNILVLQEDHVDITDAKQCDLSRPLQFIDFEYSCAGYRGFDWGNHFNEYAGFDCDYKRYPNAEAQALFFKHYMATPSSSGVAQVADLCQGELDKLMAEANLFALASHIYWGVWALIQARYSPIDFNYLEYSKLRWDEYHNRKAEFVNDAKRVFGVQ